MNFLYPLYLLGAIGVAAPIWLHLRRRQRTNVRLFSALRFLDDHPAPRDMPLRLRNLPLLLLRLLALLAIVAAFAWPHTPTDSEELLSEVRIYILDNTLSHRVDGAFERARDEIAREIRRAGPEIQIGVVEIAARTRVLAPLGSPPEDAAATVESLEPTHQRGNYLDGFRLAAGMLDRSLGTRRKILVYGDRQQNQWEENLNVPPFLRGVEVVLAEAPGKPDAGNLFASNTRVWRVPRRDGSDVNLTLDLGGMPENRSATVVVRSDAKEVMRSDLALVGGQSTVQTGWKADATGWLRGEVEISGRPDVLELDDRSYFAVPPLEPGKIGLLARSTFLRASLDPEIAEGFWDVQMLGPEQIRAEAGADRPRFDALVVDSDYLQSKEARDLLLKHLNNGKGVILFISRTTPLVQGFLRTLGFQIGEEQNVAEGGAAFRYVALNHPALEPFSRPDFGDLLAVRIQKYFKVAADKADGLLFVESGDAALFETRGTKGRMMVFPFGADTGFTNWPVRPDFLPFLDLCLRHVRAISEQQISVEPGEVLFRQIEEGAGGTFALAREGEEFSKAVADAEGRLRMAAPDAPGIYELRRTDGPNASPLLGLISVSASAKESALDYIEGTPGAIDAWTIAAANEAAPAEPIPTAAKAQPAEWFWWWLLAAGAIFLAGEMAWTASRRSFA